MRKKYVTFQLGSEVYGIDIMKVKGIEKVHDIFVVPNLPETIRGVFKLRNTIIPIFDLKKRFRFETQSTDTNTLIIISANGMEIGVLIDKVRMVMEIEDQEIQPPPVLNTGINKEYLSGIGKPAENSIVVLIDIDRLFSQEEIKNLSKLKK